MRREITLMGVYAVEAPPRGVTGAWRLQGFLAALLAAGFCAVNAFWVTPKGDATEGWDGYWPALIFCAVVAWLVFGLAVSSANAMNASDRALGLIVLAGITLPALWTGVPVVLLLGTVAVLARAHRSMTNQDSLTCFIGGIVVTGAIWMTFVR